MKFTEGRVPRIGAMRSRKAISAGKKSTRAVVQNSNGQTGGGLVIKDAIADITLNRC